MNAADRKSLEGAIQPFLNSLDRRMGHVEEYLRDDLPTAVAEAVSEHQKACDTGSLLPMKDDLRWLVAQSKAAQARQAYRRGIYRTAAKLTAYVGTLAGAIIAVVKAIESLP